jgi:4'-phosphopantetheinyl transferase
MEPPPGPPDALAEIHVWFHDVNLAPDALDALARLLSSSELAKARRYHFDADMRRSLVARASLRQHLSHYCGVDPAAIVIREDGHAKPDAPATGMYFNVSHAADFVGIAFSSACPVGFDLERIRPMRDALSIAARFFSTEEQQVVARAVDPDQAFFEVWTAKEALVKGTGTGLSSELGAFTVPMGATTLTPVGTSLPAYAGWRVASVPPPRDTYRAAVAALHSSAVIRVMAGPTSAAGVNL